MGPNNQSASVRHGLDCVHEEVDQQLLDSGLVQSECGEVGSILPVQGDLGAIDLEHNQPQAFLQQAMKVLLGEFQGSCCRQGQQIVDNRASASYGVLNILQDRGAGVVRIRRVAGEIGDAREYDLQRVFDLVRHAGRQLAG